MGALLGYVAVAAISALITWFAIFSKYGKTVGVLETVEREIASMKSLFWYLAGCYPNEALAFLEAESNCWRVGHRSPNEYWSGPFKLPDPENLSKQSSVDPKRIRFLTVFGNPELMLGSMMRFMMAIGPKAFLDGAMDNYEP